MHQLNVRKKQVSESGQKKEHWKGGLSVKRDSPLWARHGLHERVVDRNVMRRGGQQMAAVAVAHGPSFVLPNAYATTPARTKSMQPSGVYVSEKNISS